MKYKEINDTLTLYGRIEEYQNSVHFSDHNSAIKDRAILQILRKVSSKLQKNS